MKNKLIAAVLWFFGLLFIIRGLTLIGESFLGGIFMVLAGILLLPLVQKKLAASTHPISPKWLGVGIFFLLIVSGMFLQSSEERALKNGTASQEVMDRRADLEKRNAEQERIKAEKEAQEAIQKEQREMKRQQEERVIAMEVNAKMALKSVLKDPDSVKIRNQRGNCGEVNSKNSFGGYGGFKRFIATSTIVAIDGENMNESEFQKVWDSFCE